MTLISPAGVPKDVPDVNERIREMPFGPKKVSSPSSMRIQTLKTGG